MHRAKSSIPTAAVLAIGVIGPTAGDAHAVCHGNGAPFNVTSSGARLEPLGGVCNNNGSYQGRFRRGTHGSAVHLWFAKSNGNNEVTSPNNSAVNYSTTNQIVDPGLNAPVCFADVNGICSGGPWANNGF